MDPVSSWIGPFLSRHQARCHRDDWPPMVDESGRPVEFGQNFYVAWIEAFEDQGVERHHADLASRQMVADPPKWLGDHLPMLVRLALEAKRAERPALPPPVALRAPALPPPDAPEWEIKTPADLRRFCDSLAASKSIRRAFAPRRPREALLEDARAIADPVVRRERASRSAPGPEARPIAIPEDQAALGWY